MQRRLMENKTLDLREEMDMKHTVAKCYCLFVDGILVDVVCCLGYMIR